MHTYSATEIASYVYHHYQQTYGSKIEEMKFHKMLYYIQRESFIKNNAPMFTEEFEAWKFGPVMTELRQPYRNADFPECDIDDETKKIINDVFEIYGPTNPWALGMMSHEEISWQRARANTPAGENSSTKISNNDIRYDAKRIRDIRNSYKTEVPF
jgi:uncharacterized phage-associated protein